MSDLVKLSGKILDLRNKLPATNMENAQYQLGYFDACIDIMGAMTEIQTDTLKKLND